MIACHGQPLTDPDSPAVIASKHVSMITPRKACPEAGEYGASVGQRGATGRFPKRLMGDEGHLAFSEAHDQADAINHAVPTNAAE